MNYDYSQMNEIIEKQYAKKKGEKNKSNWFWEESIKYGKGCNCCFIFVYSFINVY